MFLEISQNSQENTCASLFFNKVAGLRTATLVKKRPWHRCFPVNFMKFLGIPFLQNTSGRLLPTLELVVHRCCSKQMFLWISQISQKNTCVWSLYVIKLQAWRTENLLKRDPDTGAFPVRFAKVLRTPFFHRTSPVAEFVTLLPTKSSADNTQNTTKITENLWVWRNVRYSCCLKVFCKKKSVFKNFTKYKIP